MAFTVYEPQGRLAATPAARSGVRVSPDTYGAAIGEGLQRLGSGLANFAAREAEKQDTAVVQAAYKELGDAKAQLLDDEQNGILRQRGTRALEASSGAVNYFERAAAKIAEGLKSDRQRETFQRLVDREREEFRTTVDRHAARQADEVADGALRGTLTTTISDAVRAASQGGDPLGHLALGAAAVRERGRLEGWAPELTESQVLGYTTDAHMAVLERLVDIQQPTKALEYLGAHQGEIDGKVLASSNIEKKIEMAGLRNQGRAIADGIVAKATGDKWTFDAGAALEAARQDPALKDNADLYDEVVHRIELAARQVEGARRAHDDPIIGELETELNLGRGFRKSDPRFIRLSSQGQAIVSQHALSAYRASESSSAEARREQADIDRERRSYFLSLDPERRAGYSDADIMLGPEFARATKNARNEILADRNAAKKDLENDRGVSHTMFVEQAKVLAKRLGFNKSRTDAFVLDMLNKRNGWFGDKKNAGKKNPPPEEVRAMFADWLLWGEETDGFIHSNKYKGEAERAGEGFTAKGFEDDQRGLKALGEDGQPAPQAAVPPAGAPVEPRSVARDEDIPEATRASLLAKYQEWAKQKGKPLTPRPGVLTQAYNAGER